MATKIEQLVQEIGNLSALELSQLTKELENTFGVSGAMPVMTAAVAGAAPASEAGAKKAEEKAEYKVELLEAGPDKIKTIKAVREARKNLGLGEAKKLVEDAPAVLAEAVSADEAKHMKEVLEAAGAKVKLS